MPTLSVKTQSLVPRKKPYPSGVGGAADAVQNAGGPASQELATALRNFDKSLVDIHATLRQQSTVVDQIAVVDSSGKVIAALGDFIFSGVPTTNYFSEIHVGDPLNTGDPSQALFVAANGKVTIGQNGWLDVLDPYGADAAWIGTQFDTQAVTGAADNGSGLIRITIVGHTLATGDVVRVLNVGGVPNATGIRTVTKINADHFDLQSTVFVGAYTSGGTVDRLLHVTGAANNGAGLIRLTVAAHGFESGDKANVQTVGGVPNATGQWIVTVITANTFDLVGSTFAGAFTSGGTVLRYFAGGLFQTIAVGPSFANYKLRAFADGTLKISGATISLTGPTSSITLDPSTGFITVVQVGGGGPPFNQVQLSSGQIVLNQVGAGASAASTTIGHQDTQIVGSAANAYEVELHSDVFASWVQVAGNTNTLTRSLQAQLFGYTAASAFGPLLACFQARGTGATPTASQSGDTLGGVAMWGYDGGNEVNYVAASRAVATENHAGGAHGAQLVFEVTPNGTASPLVAVTIANTGQLLVDVGATPAITQLGAKANALGFIGLYCGAADSSVLEYDIEVVSGTGIARDASVAAIRKGSAKLSFLGSTGNVVGSAASFNTLGTLNLSNGRWGFGNVAAPAYSVDAETDVNAGGVFRKAGVPGLSISRSFGTSLTVNTSATGVFGTPGAGQANGTVVTGVTLNVTSNTWAGGILTA